MIILNRKNLLIASLVPNDNTALYKGVRVTHKFSETTNGHYLVRVTTPKLPEEFKLELKDCFTYERYKPLKRKTFKAVLPKRAIEDALKATPSSKNSTFPYNNYTIVGAGSDGKFTELLNTDYGTVRAVVTENVDTQYPDTDRLIKRRKGRVVLAFNPEYMKKICDLFLKAKQRQVVMEVRSDSEPIKMTSEEDGQKITVLLMPMKID